MTTKIPVMDKLRKLLLSKLKNGEITMSELARAGGVTRQHIHNILYGRPNGVRPQPTLPLAEKLAAAVGAKLEITPRKKSKKIPA